MLLAALLWAAPVSTPTAHAPNTLPEKAQYGGASAPTVFLMHGILNKSVSMKRIERALERGGFEVVNLSYPSRSRTVEEHAAWLDEKVREKGRGELYFVGHSLGAIVIRYYLAVYNPPQAKRFLMITPPNRGSMLADTVDKTPLYKVVWGRKAGGELRASSEDFWKSLPPPPIEFAVLAGGLGNGKGFNPLIPGDDDGTLAVEETRLEGAADFKVLPYQHTSIVLKKKTAEMAVRFLKGGRF
ncbi:MAG: alpha/beta fold hydrolase [Elusimicrobiota bacterium]